MVAADGEAAVIYEYRRVVDAAGVADVYASGDIAAVPTALLEEATGVTDPDPAATVRYSIETWSRDPRESDDAPQAGPMFESGWRVVERPARQASPADFFAVMDQRRPRYGDAAIDEQVACLPGGCAEGTEPVIDPRSEDLLAGTPPGAAIAIEVCGPRVASARLPNYALFYEIAYGWDRATINAALDDLRADRRAAAALAQAPLVDAVTARGGAVLGQSDRESCIWAQVTKEDAQDLAAQTGVRRMAVSDPYETGGADSDGQSGRQGTQIDQYWDDDANGAYGCSTLSCFPGPDCDTTDCETGETPSPKAGGFADITIAVVDGGFQDQHWVFKDYSSDGPPPANRIAGRWNCTGGTTGCTAFGCDTPPTCTSSTNLPWVPTCGTPAVDHGTRTAAIAIGDLTQEQDSAIPVAQQEEYSGYAGAGGVAFMLVENACRTKKAAIDKAADLNVDAISMSLCTTGAGSCGTSTCQGPPGSNMTCRGDQLCQDQDAGAVPSVNAAFNDGVLVVKAAGNNGQHTGGCPCTVSNPAEAVGALVAGGTLNACTTAHNSVRDGAIFSCSSSGWGEIGWPGKRTMVDLVAPARRSFVAGSTSGGQPGTNCYLVSGSCGETTTSCLWGTSYAAPTIAAAAADFKDNWIEDLSPSTWLDNAGHFKTAMLLMGDRWNGTAYLTTGFDPVWGAGRLKLRKWDGPGMDTPWCAKMGTTNLLGGGDLYERWLSCDGTPSALAADVDAVEVVAWWYDTDVEVSAADIALHVWKYDSTCTTLLDFTTWLDSSYDVKKRVFVGRWSGDTETPSSDPGGYCWKMRLIRLDGEAVGRDVNWAFYYEDTDRNDDTDGSPDLCLDADNSPCGSPPTHSLNPTDIERP